MGEYDYTHNAYRVTQSAAHAWVEVYFPGLGWVEFEPTSALDTFPRRNDSGTLVSILANQNGQGKGKGAVTAGVAFLILLLGLGGLAIFLMTQAARGRFEGGASPASSRQSTALYRQMRQALALAGLRAPSSATPDEFLAACAAPLKKRTYLRSALEQATALYRQAAFSSRPPGAEAVFYARRTWQRALPEWLLAALEHLVRPRKG
jgi:hypothetical protein